jgi:hypothetical protein
VEVTELLHAVEAAITAAEQHNTRGGQTALWLTGSPVLRLAGRRPIRAKTSRSGADGRFEWGYSLRQTRRIRKRILAAFAEHAGDTGAGP